MIIERIVAEFDRSTDAIINGVVMHPATWEILRGEALRSSTRPLTVWFDDPRNRLFRRGCRVEVSDEIPLGDLVFAKTNPFDWPAAGPMTMYIGGRTAKEAKEQFEQIKREIENLEGMVRGMK